MTDGVKQMKTERIPILALPYTEIEHLPLGDGWRKYEQDIIEACWKCGSPYMIIKVEKVEKSDWSKRREIPEKELMLGSMDHSFYCAICGQSQGGIYVDNDKATSERYPPEG